MLSRTYYHAENYAGLIDASLSTDQLPHTHYTTLHSTCAGTMSIHVHVYMNTSSDCLAATREWSWVNTRATPSLQVMKHKHRSGRWSWQRPFPNAWKQQFTLGCHGSIKSGWSQYKPGASNDVSIVRTAHTPNRNARQSYNLITASCWKGVGEMGGWGERNKERQRETET